MRRVFASILGGFALTACAASYNPTPIPSPSPTPTPFPQGVPSATAFENLPLVLSLERATGRAGTLVMLGAPMTADTGRVRLANAWTYLFADSQQEVFFWNVSSDGAISTGRALTFQNLDLRDIQASLRIDSNEAVAIALRNGAREFVERYPAARVAGGCRLQAGIVTWQLEFLETGSTLCSPEFWINATDGRLLARDLDCVR